MYATTGNVDKLRRLLKIAEARGDGGQRMHVSMLLGDVLERVAVLRAAGLHALAYASAHKHGQTDLAAAILADLKEKDAEAAAAVEQEMAQAGPGTLLLPPPPITCESNWPRLEVWDARARTHTHTHPPTHTHTHPPTHTHTHTRPTQVQEGNWSAVLASAIQNKGPASGDVEEELDGEAGAGWGDDDMLAGGGNGSDGDVFKDGQLDDDEEDGGDAGGGWGIDELDLPESPGQGGGALPGACAHARVPVRDASVNPQPQTPNPKPQTPNPKPQTPNPKPQTPNPKP